MTEQEIFAPGEAIPPTHDSRLEQLEALARLMDSSFTIPGTQIRFGLDAVLGLLPVIGDTLGLAVSSYILKVAHEMGAPAHLKARMGINIAIDWVTGLVPFAGDLFDIGWKANRRNVELLRRHLQRKQNN